MSVMGEYNIKYIENNDSVDLVTDMNGNFRAVTNELDNIDDRINNRALTSHKHSADNITSGTLTVTRGGTGKSTLPVGQVLVGNGTGAITTKAISSTPALNSSNLITSGGVYSAVQDKLSKKGGDLTGELGVNYELCIKNMVDYSKNYFFLRNVCYSNTLRNHFTFGMYNTEKEEEKGIFEFFNTDEFLSFLVSIVISGKAFTSAVELYAEKGGENSTEANNGGYVDFHYNQKINTNQTAATESDYTARLIEDAPGELNVQASSDYTAKLKVAGKQVYTDDRIKAQSTDITEGSTLASGNIILVYES